MKKLIEHPAEEKYRKIRSNNAFFTRNIGKFDGGIDVLRRCGFQDEFEKGKEEYFLVLDERIANDMEFLQGVVYQLEEAISILSLNFP